MQALRAYVRRMQRYHVAYALSIAPVYAAGRQPPHVFTRRDLLLASR